MPTGPERLTIPATFGDLRDTAAWQTPSHAAQGYESEIIWKNIMLWLLPTSMLPLLGMGRAMCSMLDCHFCNWTGSEVIK